MIAPGNRDTKGTAYNCAADIIPCSLGYVNIKAMWLAYESASVIKNNKHEVL